MRSIATLTPEEAQEFLEYLKQKSLAVEVRTVIQDGGLEMSEIVVSDDAYEDACMSADRWGSAKVDELYAKRHCPKCKSTSWREVPHDRLGYVGRCQDCGCEFELK
jgi:predicted RNA-binding Zn-ribbon protein involved in translation (DUF1610 family)